MAPLVSPSLLHAPAEVCCKVAPCSDFGQQPDMIHSPRLSQRAGAVEKGVWALPKPQFLYLHGGVGTVLGEVNNTMPMKVLRTVLGAQ